MARRLLLLLLIALAGARRPAMHTVHVAFIAQDDVESAPAGGSTAGAAPMLRNTTVCETRATVLHTARHPLLAGSDAALAAEHLDMDDDARSRPAGPPRARTSPTARYRLCRRRGRGTIAAR